MVVVDKEQFDALPTSITTARAHIAQVRRDVPVTIRFARQALALLPETDYVRRRPAAALLGLAFWRRGELEEAHRALAVPSVVSGCEAQAEAIPATMNKVTAKLIQKTASSISNGLLQESYSCVLNSSLSSQISRIE